MSVTLSVTERGYFCLILIGAYLVSEEDDGQRIPVRKRDNTIQLLFPLLAKLAEIEP